MTVYGEFGTNKCKEGCKEIKEWKDTTGKTGILPYMYCLKCGSKIKKA